MGFHLLWGRGKENFREFITKCSGKNMKWTLFIPGILWYMGNCVNHIVCPGYSIMVGYYAGKTYILDSLTSPLYTAFLQKDY